MARSQSRSASSASDKSKNSNKRSDSREKSMKPQNESQQKSDQKCLYIGNIDKKCSQKQLKDLFQKYGSMEYCYIVYEPGSGNNSKQAKISRGYGFAKYQSGIDAQTAKSSLQGKQLYGRALNIQISKRDKPRQATPGRYLGRKKTSPRREERRDRDRYRKRSYSRSYSSDRDRRHKKHHQKERKQKYSERDGRKEKRRDRSHQKKSKHKRDSRSRSYSSQRR